MIPGFQANSISYRCESFNESPSSALHVIVLWNNVISLQDSVKVIDSKTSITKRVENILHHINLGWCLQIQGSPTHEVVNTMLPIISSLTLTSSLRKTDKSSTSSFIIEVTHACLREKILSWYPEHFLAWIQRYVIW